jgi:hypothetical protein
MVQPAPSKVEIVAPIRQARGMTVHDMTARGTKVRDTTAHGMRAHGNLPQKKLFSQPVLSSA